MVFNKKREERCIAETDFRKNGAMACLDGKKMLFFLSKIIAYQFNALAIFSPFEVLFTLWAEAATLTIKTAFPTK